MVDAEIHRISSVLIAHLDPCFLYAFGSAVMGGFSDHSDFDFLLVMEDVESLKRAQRNLRPFQPLSQWPIDFVWMTREDFESKSQIGGIAMIVAEEGRLLFKKDHKANGKRASI